MYIHVEIRKNVLETSNHITWKFGEHLISLGKYVYFLKSAHLMTANMLVCLIP